MKNNINSIKIIGFLLLLFSLSSCNSFLSEEPKSEFSEGNFFKDVESLHSGAVGAYSFTRDLYVVGSNTPLFMGMLGTDEAMYPAETNIRGYIDRYTFTSSDGCVKEYWKRFYKIITVCNTVIHKSQLLDQSHKEVKKYRANMYFLRAWAYFSLVQIYGELPIMLNHVTEFDYSVGRSPIWQVYDVIEGDLLAAIETDALPLKIDGGWANQWAAKALLAKVYITMASARKAGKVPGYKDIKQSDEELYGSALELLEDIIKNSDRKLEPVYGDVFKIDNKNINSETIWEIQFAKEIPYGSQWAKEYGAYAVDYDNTNLQGGWRGNALAGSCNAKYVPSLWNYYKEGDVRKNWNLSDFIIRFNRKTNKASSKDLITSLQGNPQLGDIFNPRTVQFSGVIKYRWGKTYMDEHTDFVYSNCPNNIIVLRLADVLLLYAEADLALNNNVPSQEGIDAINMVVERARGVDDDGNPIPESDTPQLPNYTSYSLDDILMERARELCFERHRWFDLARTGKMEEYLSNRNQSQHTKTSFDHNKHYLYPIPLDELQLSTNTDNTMYQNPGY